MNKQLILAVLCGGLFLYNLYLAISSGQTILFGVCALWLFAAVKNYKLYKAKKDENS